MNNNNSNKGFAIIHKQAFIEYKGRQGRLVWDYLILNELTFVDGETGEQTSLLCSPSDEKTARLFNDLVDRYGIKDESNEIIIREYQKDDAGVLADIIVRTWQFDDFAADPDAIRHLGHTYLHNCLISCSKALVAVERGRPVGIIVGTDIRKRGFRPSAFAKTMTHGIACLTNPELLKAAQKWSTYSKINDEMDKVVQKEADGEITLFIMDKKGRGRGIGKKLYSELMKYFRELGISNTYVHTDTACNYQFYEKQGMNIRLQKPTELSYAGVKNVTIFVLTGHTS